MIASQHSSHVTLTRIPGIILQPIKSFISFHSFFQVRFPFSENRRGTLSWPGLQTYLSLLFPRVTQSFISISLSHIKAWYSVISFWGHVSLLGILKWVNFTNLTVLVSTACNRNPTAVASSCGQKLEVGSPWGMIGSPWLYDSFKRPSGTQSPSSFLLCHQRMRLSFLCSNTGWYTSWQWVRISHWKRATRQRTRDKRACASWVGPL